MPQSNARETRRVVETWFHALEAGDMKEAGNCLASNVEWINPRKVEGVNDIIPWIGMAHGIEQVLLRLSTRTALVETKTFRPIDLVIEGKKAVGKVHDVSMVFASGLDYDIMSSDWVELRNGKIAKWESFYDTSPIVDAFQGNVKERLLTAVRENDNATSKILLREYRADPNIRDPQSGLTLLMMAACRANIELVKDLLDSGADVWTTGIQTGATVLHKACQGGSLEVLQLLLEKGAHIDAKTVRTGHTPLIEAIWYAWPDLVKLLVEKRQNLYFDTHYGFTLDDLITFQIKINRGKESKNKFDTIKAAVDAGKTRDANELSEQKVMDAVKRGDLQAVKELISAGANVNAVSPRTKSFFDGHTPLLVAARDGHTEIVRELLQAGADVRAKDWTFQAAPIHKATSIGNLEILKMLVNHPGIDLNVQDATNGYTPLHEALWHGYTECAEILVEKGARLDIQGHDGKLAIDIAIQVLGEPSPLVELIRSNMRSLTDRDSLTY